LEPKVTNDTSVVLSQVLFVDDENGIVVGVVTEQILKSLMVEKHGNLKMQKQQNF
jgi:hypothetical protein